MNWIRVNDRLPNKDELNKSANWEFLCCVMVPEHGGNFYKTIRIISFDIFDKNWRCEGIIITHWMPLPELPKE